MNSKTHTSKELFECPINGCNGVVSLIPYSDDFLCDQNAAHRWNLQQTDKP